MQAYQLVSNYRIYMEHFNRKEYPGLFARYQKEAAPFLEALSSAEAEAEASALLDALEADWNTHRFRFRREAVMQDDKMLLLLFLGPAAHLHSGEGAAAFADALTGEWTRRFPGSAFRIATPEEIQEGFRWKTHLPDLL